MGKPKKRKSKFNGKALEYVIELMEQNSSLSITAASVQMCEKFNFKYKDSIRSCISKLLRKRFPDGWKTRFSKKLKTKS